MFFEFVKSDGIFDHLNDSAVGSHRQDLIGSENKRQILQFEDIVELVNKLQCELLLFEVVIGFDDQMK